MRREKLPQQGGPLEDGVADVERVQNPDPLQRLGFSQTVAMSVLFRT